MRKQSQMDETQNTIQTYASKAALHGRLALQADASDEWRAGMRIWIHVRNQAHFCYGADAELKLGQADIQIDIDTITTCSMLMESYALSKR